MNKLLINEYPILVLPALAVEIGLNEAIFLQQLHYWLTPKPKYKPHYHEWEGEILPWIFNVYGEKEDDPSKETGWRENFPFWSNSTIRRIVKSLKEKNLIFVTEKFNKFKSQRKLWYTINYPELEKIEKMIEKKRESPNGQIEQMPTTATKNDDFPPPNGQIEQIPNGQIEQIPNGQIEQIMSETTLSENTTTVPAEEKASSADTDFDQAFPRQEFPQNGSKKRLTAFDALLAGRVGESGKEVQAEQDLQSSGWEIRVRAVRQAMVLILAYTRLKQVPASDGQRKRWFKALREMSDEFSAEEMRKWLSEAEKIFTEREFTPTGPEAYTKQMLGLRAVPQEKDFSQQNGNVPVYDDPDDRWKIFGDVI